MTEQDKNRAIMALMDHANMARGALMASAAALPKKQCTQASLQ